MFVNAIVNHDRREKAVMTRGSFGSATLFFFGGDVIFFRTGIFLRTKGGFFQFISLLRTVALTTNSGVFVELLLVGLGFRFVRLGGILLLKLGFAHYVRVAIPPELVVFGYKKRFVVFGLTRGAVNQFVDKIVNFRYPDVYKNKGIQVIGRVFRVKVGKQK